MSKNLLKNRQLTTDDFALSFQTVEMSEEVQGAVTLKLRCIYYKRPKKNFKNSQVQNITAQSKRIDNAKRVAVQYYGNVCYQNCTVEPDSLPVMKSSA